MAKLLQLTVRMDPKEKRALKAWARFQGKTVAELFRARMVNPALQHDPKQAVFALGKEPLCE